MRGAGARECDEGVCGGMASTQRKRGLSRFSLRRLLYSSPLVTRRINRSSVGSSHAPHVRHTGPSRDVERAAPAPGEREKLQRVNSRASASGSEAGKSGNGLMCPLCLFELPVCCFPELLTCAHRSCYDCFQKYLRVEISESRVRIACPECSEPMHPSDIRMILNDNIQFEKYEDFMVRRVLACDPDTRWCPAPDCSFAVIAAGCASCPKIKCERPGCDAHFCYHCKAEWHPNQTCDAARAQRSPNARSSSVSFNQDQHRDEIKPCPRCQVLIVKMDDGSCNHMTCAVCGAEFCWLCMKEVSDLHFLSPSGCTFWGKKPWSRKKKILWQLGTLVGAPVGIGLIAGIAVPAMIIGIPVWVGKKLYTRYECSNKHKRNLAILGGVTAAVMVSPFLAGLAVSIGAPVLLFYVYGVVPVSMCRSGGCGVSNGAVRVDLDDLDVLSNKNTDVDAVSHRGANPSIGEVSISLGSGSQLERLGREPDRESASNVALAGASLTGVSLTGASLAGSITSSLVPGGQRLEVQADVALTQRFSMSSETASAATSLSEKSVSASLADDGGASTRALAGSMLNYKMDSASGVVSVEDTMSGSLEELASGPLRRTANRRRPNLDRQMSDTGSADSAMGGSDDCVSMDRVRFDDNVSFIEAASPVSVGSARSGRSDKTADHSSGSEFRNHSEKSNLRGLLFHSTGNQINSIDKRIQKLRKPSPHSLEVDLSGIEISVDGKSLEVIPEPQFATATPPSTPDEITIGIEVTDMPSTSEMSPSPCRHDSHENREYTSVTIAEDFERLDV